MLAISPSTSQQKLTPNILPCSIKHNGPIPTAPRHWDPKPTKVIANSSSSSDDNAPQEVYLRGRKLLGKPVKLPEGYGGVVLQKTDKIVPPKAKEHVPGEDDEDEEMGEEVAVGVMETKGTFEEVVVWGHEAVPDEEDVYVKGLGEWVGFAQAMHSYDTPKESGS